MQGWLRRLATVLAALGPCGCLLTIDRSLIDEEAAPPAPSSCDAYTGPIVDIRERGARCDGSDDWEVIQQALDGLKTGDVLDVSCMAGLSQPLVLDQKNGVAIRGSGGFEALPPNTTALLGVYNCTDCAVCGLTLEGRGLAAGLRFEICEGTKVDGNIVKEPGNGTGIFSGEGKDESFIDNTVENGAATEEKPRGIWVATPNEAVITGNAVRNMPEDAFVLYAGALTATGNVVDGTRGAGLNIHPATDAPGPWRLEGNTIRGADGGGVVFRVDDGEPAVTAMNLSFSGNTVEECAGLGVSFNREVTVTDATFSGNLFRNNHAGAAPVIGQLAIRSGSGITIEDNQLVDERQGPERSDGGIVLEAHFPITAVTIAHNLMKNHTDVGLLLSTQDGGTIDEVAVTDCIFEQNSVAAVMIEGNVLVVDLARSNCFSKNQATVVDNRSQPLSPPDNEESCPPFSP